MKSSKNTKILLLIVIILWGIFIYKVIDALNPDQVETTQIAKSKFIAPQIQEKEKFELLPLEKDPFLGTLYRKEAKQTKISNKGSQSNKEIKWPLIEFFGIVSGKNTKVSVYIVGINRQQHLLRKGEEIDDVKLVKGSNESITINFKGQTKKFAIM